MNQTLKNISENIWQLVVLRGLVLLGLGLAILVSPGITMAVLLIFLAIYIIIDGFFQIIEGFASIKFGWHWILAVLLGVLEIGIGIYVISYPNIAILTLVFLVGLAFIIRGFIDIIRGIVGYSSGSRILAVIGGLLAIAVGILFIGQPISFAFLLWIYAIFTIVAGPILVIAGFSFRNTKKVK